MLSFSYIENLYYLWDKQRTKKEEKDTGEIINQKDSID